MCPISAVNRIAGYPCLEQTALGTQQFFIVFWAVTQLAGTTRQQHRLARDGQDDDIFMRDSRAEVEAARRLLDRHSSVKSVSALENDADRAFGLTPRVVEAAQQRADDASRGCGGGGGGGKIAGICVKQPLFSSPSDAPSHVGAPEGADTNRDTILSMAARGTRSRPSDTTATAATATVRATARGPADISEDGAAENFYRAALSTHISFITTSAADDTTSRRRSQDGDAFQNMGRQEAGGVGEACRALHGDVAGVRQVRARERERARQGGGHDGGSYKAARDMLTLPGPFRRFSHPCDDVSREMWNRKPLILNAENCGSTTLGRKNEAIPNNRRTAICVGPRLGASDAVAARRQKKP